MYSHSIRNRLFFVQRHDELEYAVTDHNRVLLSHGKLVFTDITMLESVLNNTGILNEIFSSVSLTYSNRPFVIHPSSITKKEDVEALYAINYKIKEDEQLVEGKIAPNILTAFSIDEASRKLIKQKYPTLTYHHESELFTSFIQSNITAPSKYLVLNNTSTETLIYIGLEKELLLLNRYATDSLNDVFYFVMLAIEQLGLDIETLSLFWLEGSNTSSFGEVETMYQDYVKHIHKKTVNPELSIAMGLTLQCA